MLKWILCENQNLNFLKKLLFFKNMIFHSQKISKKSGFSNIQNAEKVGALVFLEKSFVQLKNTSNALFQ